ncbi:MAG: DUF1573 domain-containing protein [Chryseolinea sp.]
MKTIALTFLLATAMPGFKFPLSMIMAPHSEVAPFATFDWEATTHDFGKVKLNGPVTHEFKFVNNSDEPLVISSVQASCGCTVTQYSKDPVPPGGKGFVSATYNAAKEGIFSKTVTVNANTEQGSFQLTIKGEVAK